MFGCFEDNTAGPVAPTMAFISTTKGGWGMMLGTLEVQGQVARSAKLDMGSRFPAQHAEDPETL